MAGGLKAEVLRETSRKMAQKRADSAGTSGRGPFLPCTFPAFFHLSCGLDGWSSSSHLGPWSGFEATHHVWRMRSRTAGIWVPEDIMELPSHPQSVIPRFSLQKEISFFLVCFFCRNCSVIRSETKMWSSDWLIETRKGFPPLHRSMAHRP